MGYDEIPIFEITGFNNAEIYWNCNFKAMNFALIQIQTCRSINRINFVNILRGPGTRIRRSGLRELSNQYSTFFSYAASIITVTTAWPTEAHSDASRINMAMRVSGKYS